MKEIILPFKEIKYLLSFGKSHVNLSVILMWNKIWLVAIVEVTVNKNTIIGTGNFSHRAESGCLSGMAIFEAAE